MMTREMNLAAIAVIALLVVAGWLIARQIENPFFEGSRYSSCVETELHLAPVVDSCRHFFEHDVPRACKGRPAGVWTPDGMSVDMLRHLYRRVQQAIADRNGTPLPALETLTCGQISANPA